MARPGFPASCGTLPDSRTRVKPVSLEIVRHLLALPVAAAAIAAVPASGSAASRPSFAHSYRGALSGLFTDTHAGNKVTARWKVTQVVLRLTKVQAFEGGFTGLYKVTRGSVSYSETESGNCSYTATSTFGLARAIPRNGPSVPFALDQDPLGRRTMLGLINVNQKLKTTESCPDPNGGPPSTAQRTLSLPTLFDPGEKRWSPGRRLHRTNTQRDTNSKTSWTWDLKPGRERVRR